MKVIEFSNVQPYDMTSKRLSISTGGAIFRQYVIAINSVLFNCPHKIYVPCIITMRRLYLNMQKNILTCGLEYNLCHGCPDFANSGTVRGIFLGLNLLWRKQPLEDKNQNLDCNC